MNDRHARHRHVDVDSRRRPPSGYRASSQDRFARLVDDALSTLPADLLAYVDNVQIMVEDVPPEDPVGRGDEVILGLYVGVPKTARGEMPPILPDRITLYRRPIEARAASKADLADLVREVVVHELAHHFGIDDDRLDELGY